MTQPEFSRPIRVDGLPPEEAVLEIAAEEAECAALAERLGLLALESLEATVRLEKKGRGVVALQASLRARVVQSCVVTLEPVESGLEATFERRYDPKATDEEAEEEELGSEDLPDPLVDGTIDIGEAVAEHLALELDPFPRAPGASFEGYSTASPEEEAEMAPPNPFAALARLKDGKDGA